MVWGTNRFGLSVPLSSLPVTPVPGTSVRFPPFTLRRPELIRGMLSGALMLMAKERIDAVVLTMLL